MPAYPKYSHSPAIILLLIECSLGKPRLICAPESGGHATVQTNTASPEIIGLA